MQTHGGMGFTSEIAPVHARRDRRIVDIADGGSEIPANAVDRDL